MKCYFCGVELKDPATHPYYGDSEVYGEHRICAESTGCRERCRAALAHERTRCARVARSPRTGTWDAYSLAEAIARDIEEGRA